MVVASSAYHEKAHVEFSLGPREVHQSNHWIFQISSLRIGREQHVPESSNHSLYLMNLFVFSCPEGNKAATLFDSFSPPSPGITNDLTPRASTSVCLSQTSFTIFQVLAQTTFKITERRHIHKHIHIHIHILNKYLYMCHHESSRTPQHSKWNCVGTNRPQHKHMYGHMVCL